MIQKAHIITEEEATFPSTPFLLLDDPSVGGKAYIVESWKVTDIDILRDCHFSQTIEFTGHDATEEEIGQYTRGDEKGNI